MTTIHGQLNCGNSAKANSGIRTFSIFISLLSPMPIEVVFSKKISNGNIESHFWFTEVQHFIVVFILIGQFLTG